MTKKLISFLVFSTLMLFYSFSLKAQNRLKTDSTRIVYRQDKFPCPDMNAEIFFEAKASPLPQYCFYSTLKALYLISDSLNNPISKIDYSYYFDDSSYFVALKKSSEKNAMNSVAGSVFMIEEIKDSLHFEINLAGSNRRPEYLLRKNCFGNVDQYKIAKQEKALQFTKSGNKKTIQGYLCEEYIFENENEKSIFWGTLSDGIWLQKIRADLTCFAELPELIYCNKGIILESETFSKGTKTTEIFKVKEVNLNTFFRVSSDGYILKANF